MGTAFDASLIINFLPQLVKYLGITLEILFFSTIFGIFIGLITAFIKITKLPVFSQLATIYISFIRGTPILIQLFVVYYGLPLLIESLLHIDLSRMDPFYFVIIAYALSHGAIFAEIFRSAIQSIDRGQTEAAYTIGMHPIQVMLRIILPQALRTAFPNMANTIIASLKDTSLAFSIGVMDMMGRGETLIASTAHAIEVYLSLSIIYYVIVIIFERGFKLYEKRLNRYSATKEGGVL